MKHRRTDPACSNFKRPKGWWSWRRFNRNRGKSCPRCFPPTMPGAVDALDVWDSSWPPGGFVCSKCGTPTESEPCSEHQPIAYSKID